MTFRWYSLQSFTTEMHYILWICVSIWSQVSVYFRAIWCKCHLIHPYMCQLTFSHFLCCFWVDKLGKMLHGAEISTVFVDKSMYTIIQWFGVRTQKWILLFSKDASIWTKVTVTNKSSHVCLVLSDQCFTIYHHTLQGWLVCICQCSVNWP